MISYSSVQRPLARKLYDRLVQCDCNPKLDHLDISSADRWRQTIAWWLSACQTAVVLLSPEAMASRWVRYELSVLSNREKVEKNMRLVLVYVGVSPEKVHNEPDFEPFQLAEIQSYYEFADAFPADEVVVTLAETIRELADLGEPPAERLVARVADEVRGVAPGRLASARSALPAGADDPWLSSTEDGPPGFARAFCSTPLDATYDSLETLAHDRQLATEDVDDLVDLNVMTTFDSRTIDHLHQAAEGDVRRALVTATTRADLAELATHAVEELYRTRMVYRFAVNGPITGFTAADVAEGLAEELRHAIESSWEEDPDEFLAAMANRKHPVFALLANAVGLTSDVLDLLEQRFPWVVFVVLSSADRPMGSLAKDLGIVGTGLDLDDEIDWAHHVANDRELAEERSSMRKDLRRVKAAMQR